MVKSIWLGISPVSQTRCSIRTSSRQVSPANSAPAFPSLVAFSSLSMSRSQVFKSSARIFVPPPALPFLRAFTAARISA